MRHAFALLVVAAGWLGCAWSGFTGLMFTGVLLMGFIGTRGNEGGGPLLAALLFTIVVPSLCWGLALLGRRMARRALPAIPTDVLGVRVDLSPDPPAY